MQPHIKRDAVDRLKTVRGHLDGIIRMLDDDAYCVDLMKQLSATQASLERVNRLILKNHLETCFAEAVETGQGQAAVDELVDAVKFTPVLTGPEAALTGEAAGEPRSR
jgi:DNA-binding FrmR family transcriptional regulator